MNQESGTAQRFIDDLNVYIYNILQAYTIQGIRM